MTDTTRLIRETPWPEALLGLHEGSAAEAREAVGELLDGVYDQGDVDRTGPAVIDALVAIAGKTSSDARAACALGIVLLIASGNADEGTHAAAQEKLHAAASRFSALAKRAGLAGEAAAACAALARGKGADDTALENAERIFADAEIALGLEGTRAETNERRSPSVLDERLAGCSFRTPSEELTAVSVAADCAAVGRWDDVLGVCAELSEKRLLGEPHRIRALVGKSRFDEARRAVIDLARAWLTPATSVSDASQALLRSDVLGPLHAVAGVAPSPDAELDELIASVERAEPDVFIPDGDGF